MGESSSPAASYIRTVQHLIEQCLVFHMSKDECVEALARHGNIKPVITSTVWKELEKENREFFEAYTKVHEEKAAAAASETQAAERIQRLLAEIAGATAATKEPNKEDDDDD